MSTFGNNHLTGVDIVKVTLICFVGIIFLAVLFFVIFPPGGFFPFWGGPEANRAEVLRNIGLSLLGAVGLPFVIWRSITAHREALHSAENLRLSERGQNIDRMKNAFELLNSELRFSRETGIIILKEVFASADELSKLSNIQVMTSYFNDKCRVEKNKWLREIDGIDNEGEITRMKNSRVLRQDITLALETLSFLNRSLHTELTKSVSLQLQKAYLCNYPGSQSTLFLSNADLTQADMENGQFAGTYWTKATLSGADLRSANLRGGFFEEAKLIQALMQRTDFRNAKLHYANFENAILVDACFVGADLSEANFTDAVVVGALVEEQWMHLFTEVQRRSLNIVDHVGNIIRPSSSEDLRSQSA
ncbi:pentapeptide repeat-containing protein [Pseudovibrio sp. Alg231-02]|uniref:pentapeptide repeat-containing protein n=1 Tax=Pseudovibrio sp. Alg231-02 TaxID=1922223 RepID=UPI000D557D7A|nr:pentapeptide repeat-containing protein [Pseudovibrio sp. Alg231-02]